MGFRWSVDIGHFATCTLIARSVKILSQQRHSFKIHPIPFFMSKHQVPYTLEIDRPLIYHIIDDITIITVDWPNEKVRKLHRILRQLPSAAIYPVSNKMSCPVDTVIHDSVPFIGLNINLKAGSVSNQPDKYKSLPATLNSVLNTSTIPVYLCRKLTGKLC